MRFGLLTLASLVDSARIAALSAFRDIPTSKIRTMALVAVMLLVVGGFILVRAIGYDVGYDAGP